MAEVASMSMDVAEADEPGDIFCEVARHGCDLDHYGLYLVTSGALRGNFNGAGFLVSVGDIYILDLAQTTARRVEAASTISFTLPRQALETVAGKRKFHGTVLKARWPMTRLIASYLRELCLLDVPLPDTQAVAAQEAVLLLLSAALKSHGPGDATAASPLSAGLHQRITEFMARNIYLLELSPDFLCRRFKVSRAHLYRAFATEGGVAKVLRDMRLDAVYRELTQTERAPRSITELAYTLGFSSSNQLLRSFRARFGMTPSEARTGGTRTSNQGQEAVALHAWLVRVSGRATSR